MDITTIGIDIAKRNFQIHGVNKNGKTVLKKKLMRAPVLTFMANLPKCLVGIEACGGAKLSNKGKSTKVIIVAVMRKLLHIIFGVIRNNTSFNPNLSLDS